MREEINKRETCLDSVFKIAKKIKIIFIGSDLDQSIG